MGAALPGQLNADFFDASRFRVVPDHQEIFMHDQSGACIIVELLDFDKTVADEDAALFHFNELAKANRAQGESEGVEVAALPARQFTTPRGTVSASQQIVRGLQHVPKFNEEDRPNDVMVVAGLLRLPDPYWTDILVSVSAPLRIAPGSSEERYVKEPLTPEAAQAMLEGIFASLEIRDFGLFVMSD